MKIYEHTIQPECNLYYCDILYNEIKASGIRISEEYSDTSLRLVFGANISIDNNEYEKIAYIEYLQELEEWKKLSDAVKAYREKKGEKKDVEWVKCTTETKDMAVDTLISSLITINEKFEKVYDYLSSLMDGIEEQQGYE